jgi:hypothetical protein
VFVFLSTNTDSSTLSKCINESSKVILDYGPTKIKLFAGFSQDICDVIAKKAATAAAFFAVN